MKTTRSCLICFDPTDTEGERYHSLCSRKLFGFDKIPLLPYSYSELKELAKKVVQSRVTVPGVQAKLSLNLENTIKESSRFTMVGLWGDYILKPPMEIYPFMPEIEHLTMHLAALFKIETVPHALIPLKTGGLAYITRRIDRPPNKQKLHMEDMCQLSGRLTEAKYQGSMEQIGKLIRTHSSNPLLDCIRFFEVALFSFLTGNADMHLKNFSLIYPLNGMIQLAPAYDLLATRLFIPEKDDPEEMALALNGKRRNLTMNDFRQFASNLRLNDKQVKNILTRFSKTLSTTEAVLETELIPNKQKKMFSELMTARAERLGIGIRGRWF